MRICTEPNYFILKPFSTKNFFKDKPNVGIHPPITMHINTPILRQQIPHQHQPLVNHADERIRAFTPGVAIGDFFQDVGPFGEGFSLP
jgi:hypothetical protein